VFQKTRYYWDFDRKTFRGISFPTEKYLKEYVDWKGYQDEGEIKAAEGIFGKNE
jgi:cation-transporting ATPase 13A1